MIGSSSPAGGPGPPAALFEPPEGPAPPPDRLLVPADIRRDPSLVVVEELPPLDDSPSLPIPLLSFACRFAELMEELEADVDVAPEPDPDGEAAMVAPGVIGSADDACITLLVAVDAIEPPLPGPPPPVPLPAAFEPPAEAPPVLPLAPFPFCCCDFIIDGADADDDGVEDAVTDDAAVGDCGEETEVEPLPRRKASRSSSVWWERDFVFTPGAGLAPDEGPILWKYSIPAAVAPPPPAPPAPL
uniref:Uncharacterized protein n=1 Tax=Anopheles merus TaxID=30066 RepID=A0A182UNZ5_ANOME